jgi:hypothetical protein
MRQHPAAVEVGRKALGVTKSAISKDLAGIVSNGNNQTPAKTASNPKGAGRPKRAKDHGSVSKFGRATDNKIASLVLDEAKTYEEAGAEVGVSNIVVRTAVAREQGRRQAQADPPIDPDTLSLSAQQKLEAAIRQHKRKLELEFEARAQQRLQDALNDTVLPAYNETYAIYRDLCDTRKGLMTKATYNKIASCLHPDSRNSVTDEKLHDVFHIWRSLEIRLLDETQRPTPTFAMPRTYEELMAAKRKVQEARRAKRNQSNGVATR